MPRTKGSKNRATTSADFDAQIKKLQKDKAKKSLDHLGKTRHAGPRCPRCGAEPNCYDHQQQALSRYAEIMVCNTCGTVEAMEDFLGEATSLTDWAIVKAGWVE